MIGKQTGIGFSAYQHDGGVALADIPYRTLKTSYSGVFRFAVKRIAVSRDDEAQSHVCHVTLDIAWEPHLQPLYLSLDRAAIDFAKSAKGVVQSEKLERQTAAQCGRLQRDRGRAVHEGAGSDRPCHRLAGGGSPGYQPSEDAGICIYQVGRFKRTSRKGSRSAWRR